MLSRQHSMTLTHTIQLLNTSPETIRASEHRGTVFNVFGEFTCKCLAVLPYFLYFLTLQQFFFEFLWILAGDCEPRIPYSGTSFSTSKGFSRYILSTKGAAYFKPSRSNIINGSSCTIEKLHLVLNSVLKCHWNWRLEA